MSFPVIEFIQIETHWNKNNLKTVYDKLVEKGFIEPNKGESFVSFFLGYDEVNDIQAIKWYKTPSNHNFSAIEFLLIGLKALDQLGEYVIKFNEIILFFRFSKNRLHCFFLFLSIFTNTLYSFKLLGI